MRRAVTFLVCFVLALGSAACISQPTMEIHSARITQASLAGVELSLSMTVKNDNAFDVMVRAVRADVLVAKSLRLPTEQRDVLAQIQDLLQLEQQAEVTLGISRRGRA